MSKGADKTTTETTSQQQQMGWQPAMGMLQNQVLPLLGQAGSQPLQYTGGSYIAPTALQNQGTAAQQAYLQGGGQQNVNQALGAWQGALDPSSFMSAPGAYAPLDTFARNAARAYSENFAPQLRDAAYSYGQGGGYSSERAQADALERSRIAGDIGQQSALLTGNLWQQGLNARQGALGMAPGMFQLGMAPGQGFYQLGAQQRGELQQQQALGNAALEFQQMEPWRRAQMLGQQLGGYAGLGGTVDSTGHQLQTVQKGSDPLGMAASLGMMGFGLATGNPAAVTAGLSGLGGGGGGAAGGTDQQPTYAGTGKPFFGWGGWGRAPAPASTFDLYQGL